MWLFLPVLCCLWIIAERHVNGDWRESMLHMRCLMKWVLRLVKFSSTDSIMAGKMWVAGCGMPHSRATPSFSSYIENKKWKNDAVLLTRSSQNNPYSSAFQHLLDFNCGGEWWAAPLGRCEFLFELFFDLLRFLLLPRVILALKIQISWASTLSSFILLIQ